ncbi:hypothetical protein ID0444_01530 [Helicobacter pylori]
MKIRAIIIAVLFSGGLLISYDISEIQKQIDQSRVDPLDPIWLKK